jgi:hypothetical protein
LIALKLRLELKAVKKLLFYIFIPAFICASVFTANAQRNDWGGPFAVGVGLGPTSYIGDLNEHNENRFLIIPQSLSFAGQGWFSKGVGPFTLVLRMNLGRLQSRDYTKNQQFRTNFYDYAGLVQINVNKILLGKRYYEDNWHFYLQGGFSMMRFSGYLTDMSETELISEVGYAAIGKATSITGGAGIKYYMTDEASLHIGVDYNMLNSDEVDAKVIGVSNDAFIMMSIGVSYEFGDFSSRSSRRGLRWGRF